MGMLQSARSINQLITAEVDSGIDSSRIVLGGFSQGGTMSLLTGLTGERKLAGLAVLSGWLPIRQKIKAVSHFRPLHKHGSYSRIYWYRWPPHMLLPSQSFGDMVRLTPLSSSSSAKIRPIFLLRRSGCLSRLLREFVKACRIIFTRAWVTRQIRMNSTISKHGSSWRFPAKEAGLPPDWLVPVFLWFASLSFFFFPQYNIVSPLSHLKIFLHISVACQVLIYICTSLTLAPCLHLARLLDRVSTTLV